jgi:predicted permease
MLMWAAVAAVFVLGCVNIGGMLLARASGRIGEISTRLALGAPLSRIVRQLLVESIVLGLFGGAAGAVVGWGALAALRNLGANSFSFLATVEPDWRVLAATILLTLLAGVAFGIMPAWQASRVDLRTAQSGGSRSVAGRKRFVSLGALVSGQVALTVPLLIGAGLLLRTFLHLWTLNPGFDPTNLLAARFSLQDARYNTPEKMNQLFDKALERLRQTPGIESAAATLSLPYERWLNTGLRIPGRDLKGSNITNLNYVTTDFFSTLRIPLLRGRVFTPADSATSVHVAVANQAFAQQYLGGEEALGRPVLIGRTPTVIVGVVGDLQQRPGWGTRAPLTQPPALYIPSTQTDNGFLAMVHTWFAPNWVVRSSLPGPDLRRAIEDVTRSVDPLLPMASFHSVSEMKASSLTFQRFLAVVVGAIAALAMLLSALGIYGLIANLVAERTRELGLRMALGSSVSAAVQTALRPGLVWVAAGAILGGAAALLVEKLVKSYLWGVTASDPTTLVFVAVGLLAAASLASLMPALRITRLNPADTLRAE